MAFDEALAARVRLCLARRKSVEEKRMFGGTGFGAATFQVFAPSVV